MDKLKFTFLLIFTTSLLFGQSRIKYNEQELFLSGVNLAWLSFANDIGSGNTNLDEFAEILLKIHENGGNSLRWWLHTNGVSSPEFNTQDYVISPGEYTIQDLRNVLDLAWEREIGLKLCLWSFDMLRGNLNTAVRDRNILLLTDTSYTNKYIENALIPMVDSLRNHPAIIAWEIFNEPEGMSDEFGWSEILHVPMEDIQRFINLTSGAIHRTDTSVQVTSGCWSMQAMTDVPTSSLAKQVELLDSSEKEKIAEAINQKYNFDLSTNDIFSQLKMISLAANKNYYSDEALIAAGGDSAGTLDFYSVHYYDWAGTALSPFHNSSTFWELDKPIVVAEFHMVNTLGVPKTDLYTKLFQNSYAGALGWSWTDNAVTNQIDMLEGMKSLWDNYRSEVDVDGIGGDWPTVSILSPADNQKFSDTSEVIINIEANDNDGIIEKVEIIANDSIKVVELLNPPYSYNWKNIEPGNYNIQAYATDNEGHTRKSSVIRIVYGEPPFKRHEAEANTIPVAGLTIIGDPTASGGAYSEMRQTTGKIKWTIDNFSESGNYEMRIGYRLSFDSPKGQFLNVNGSRITEIMFEGDVNKWLEKSIFIDLIKGENTIEIEASWGWMDIDYIAIPRDILTSINEDTRHIEKFSLQQNYPNPFNPTTRINYSLANNEKVELVIFDIIGRKVDVLVNEEQSAGQYEIIYSAHNLSSGVYIYTLQTKSYSKHRKMIFIK